MQCATRYLSYYIPCLTWMQQYKLSFIKGDLVAALTVASFYLPMALSLASNLAHVPPIHGLYSFVFNPLVYALLGSCPQMIVGPEAAGSLLVGSVVKQSVDSGGDEDNDVGFLPFWPDHGMIWVVARLRLENDVSPFLDSLLANILTIRCHAHTLSAQRRVRRFIE